MGSTKTMDMSNPDHLCDPDLYVNGAPEALWASLRAQGSVHKTYYEGRPFFSVVSHSEISSITRNSRCFSSEHGMRLDQNPAASKAAAGKMLIVSDPPKHGEIRRIISRAFTPRMVARLKDTMRETVSSMFDTVLGQTTCDFAEIAAILPLTVICDMLGVPPADRAFMLDRTMVAFGSNTKDQPLAAVEAHADILSYYAQLVEQKRRRPEDDIVSALAHGKVEGRPLTDEEIFLNCDGLISGGNETTRHASVGGVFELIRNPEQFDILREYPETIPDAVQEILRFTSPALHILRTATSPVTVGDVSLEPGDTVALWLAAGNRDHNTFTHANRFDVTRNPNPHLSFSSGPHHCLGAALASMELTVLLEELIGRVKHVELDARPIRTRSILIWGYDSLPLRFSAK